MTRHTLSIPENNITFGSKATGELTVALHAHAAFKGPSVDMDENPVPGDELEIYQNNESLMKITFGKDTTIFKDDVLILDPNTYAVIGVEKES